MKNRKNSHIEFARGSLSKVFVKFSNEQTRSNFYLGRQDSWVPIEKCETEIAMKKGSAFSSIQITKFTLRLSCTSTVHKVQSFKFRRRCC